MIFLFHTFFFFVKTSTDYIRLAQVTSLEASYQTPHSSVWRRQRLFNMLQQVKGQTYTHIYIYIIFSHRLTFSLLAACSQRRLSVVCVPVQVSTDLSMLMAQRLKMEAVHSITSMVIRPSQMVVLRVHTPSWN